MKNENTRMSAWGKAAASSLQAVSKQARPRQPSRPHGSNRPRPLALLVLLLLLALGVILVLRLLQPGDQRRAQRLHLGQLLGRDALGAVLRAALVLRPLQDQLLLQHVFVEAELEDGRQQRLQLRAAARAEQLEGADHVAGQDGVPVVRGAQVRRPGRHLGRAHGALGEGRGHQQVHAEVRGEAAERLRHAQLLHQQRRVPARRGQEAAHALHARVERALVLHREPAQPRGRPGRRGVLLAAAARPVLVLAAALALLVLLLLFLLVPRQLLPSTAR
mmetsp:Transcript_30251/g.47354  ORF Transcript_30251/g.47354 Transcript_30251/m.47354 type:complete len:276 (+) Transcript_30251:329-1156(+)